MNTQHQARWTNAETVQGGSTRIHARNPTGKYQPDCGSGAEESIPRKVATCFCCWAVMRHVGHRQALLHGPGAVDPRARTAPLPPRLPPPFRRGSFPSPCSWSGPTRGPMANSDFTEDQTNLRNPPPVAQRGIESF